MANEGLGWDPREPTTKGLGRGTHLGVSPKHWFTVDLEG